MEKKYITLIKTSDNFKRLKIQSKNSIAIQSILSIHGFTSIMTFKCMIQKQIKHIVSVYIQYTCSRLFVNHVDLLISMVEMYAFMNQASLIYKYNKRISRSSS
jgi:hypothetical protein